MYLKSIGWEFEIWKDSTITQIDPFTINDQDFVDEIKSELLDNLSSKKSLLFETWRNPTTTEIEPELLDNLTSKKSSLIKKYAWTYFTWYKDIDEQIFNAVSSLSSRISNSTNNIENESNDKMKKLLFILKRTIIKNFFFHWLSLCNSSKSHLESVLLTALDKYSIEELEEIFSFDNITFDILDNLNWLENSEITEIIENLKTKIQTKFFPTYLTKDNFKNIKPNISFLEKRWHDKLEFIKSDYVLNTCHIRNWKWCMTDLLLLPNDVFQIVEPQLESLDNNMISFFYSGYEFYKNFFDRVRKKNLSKEEIKRELSVIGSTVCWDWIFFWVDTWLPIEMISTNKIICHMTYEQCAHIYNSITKDPNQLIKLFSKDYNTILFLYDNITKDLDEIYDLYYSIRNSKLDDIKTIYDEIDDYDKFKTIIHRFDHDEITWDEFSVIAFFCRHFKNDVLDWIDNGPESKIFKLTFTRSADVKFFYEKWICTSLDDFIILRNSNILLANIELIKFYYDKWICKTMREFLTIANSGLLSVNQEKIEFVYHSWLCRDIDDFIEYKQIIICLNIDLLENIIKLCDKEHNERSNLLKKICDSSYSRDDKENIISKITNLPITIAKKYEKVLEAFDKSISFDIQVVKDVLIMDVLEADNPEEIVKKVDAIFLESNLPIISKIFQVFKYVYHGDKLESRLKDDSSPYLKSCKTYEKKLEVIYRDLMNIMIKSGESSLKEFIQDIITCKQVLFDFENGKTLGNTWNRQVLSLMKKMASVNNMINTHWVKNTEILEHSWEIDDKTLKTYYNNLRKSLLIREDDSIYTFFLNLYKKIWYSSLEDIIIDMDKSQRHAHEDWISMVNAIQNWEIFKESYDYFLKWINIESFWEILNRGVTSTEYLWWWDWSNDKISSNATPFDTDGVIVNWKNIFDVAKSHWYGNLAIIINTNKPWIYNTDTWLYWYNPNMYEIFKNHGKDSDYHWIRTGISSTEFDAIIYKSKDIDLWQLQKIKYLIAKNWFYLPIFDLDKNLLFTVDEYHKLRQWFSFSDKFQWYDAEQKDWIYISTDQDDSINQWDEKFNSFIQRQKIWDNLDEKINNRDLAKNIFDQIKNILESELWIQCNQKKNLLWTEFYDSGSTWRWTEIPSNDIDLDFTLLLNSEDYERLETIKKTIHEKIWTTESNDHVTVDWNWLQIKSVKNDLWKEYGYKEWIHFDLLILKKTKSYLYPSNISMKDRLQKIEKLYGKDTSDFVKENIVIMKKLLKSQWTYKNTEWWMWWIGVENWIMQHHWNFIEALETFEKVAYLWEYEEWKSKISFEEFKNSYSIRDSWQNFKDWNNDNYIYKMDESWYNWILNIIKKYRTEWLNWIRQLLQNYQEIKSEYLK